MSHAVCPLVAAQLTSLPRDTFLPLCPVAAPVPACTRPAAQHGLAVQRDGVQ